MHSRFSLMNSGLYPETLPPCFVSKDAKRAFHGIVGNLDKKQFHERKTDYVRYSATKHDGSRRLFGTPNIASYFYISTFIWKNWEIFTKSFQASPYSIGEPVIMSEGAERAIKVPSLSELSRRASQNLRHAPYVLKTDIAQCFPSIYTHSISWAAHGIEKSKADINKVSSTNNFNALDFFVRSAQRGHTRGVLIGPDAYRLVAEFVLSTVDMHLKEHAGRHIVGAVRHVDDFYIGLKSEYDAQTVLSHLRETLSLYELNINDQKTKIQSSLEPINDLWAQRLRDHTNPYKLYSPWEQDDHPEVERAICEAVQVAKETGSDSPLKILFRSFDIARVYEADRWGYVEHHIQRIIQKHPHAIDYACLLVAKRKALGLDIDEDGWKSVAEVIIRQGIAFNHHHEIAWMVWLLLVCNIEISQPVIDELSGHKNSHIRSLLIQAYIDGKLSRKPKLSLGGPLSSVDANWLASLVARASGFSKASFSGQYSDEFEHLANRRIVLIDFKEHIDKIGSEKRNAISRVRYGYDDDDSDHEDAQDEEGKTFDEFGFEIA